MKTVAIFKENKPVTIQRFEGNLQVGQRQVYMADFIRSLTDELPIGCLVEKLIERRTDLDSYLNDAVDDGDEAFTSLLTHILKQVDVNWYEDNVHLQHLAFVALSKLNIANPNDENVIKLLQSMIEKHTDLSMNSHFGDLTMILIKKFLMENTDAMETQKKITKMVLSILVQEEPEIKTIFKNLVPHFDNTWLINTLNDAITEKKQGANSVLGEAMIPKGCVFLQVGSYYTTYVLEVPKSQIRVKYFDTAFENVGHPRMLCIVKVRGENILDMSLCAIPEKAEISPSMMIYKYPYSNVFESGKVCWTGYSEPGMVKNLSQLANIFLSTTNNSHLKSNVRELFEQNSGKVFNDTSLEPFKSSVGVVTLQQLF